MMPVFVRYRCFGSLRKISQAPSFPPRKWLRIQRDRRPSPVEDAPTPWALAGLGMQFFVAVLLFAYAGNWMDTRFGTSPLFVLAGVIGGGGFSFFYLSYRRLMRKVNSTNSKGSDNDTSRRP